MSALRLGSQCLHAKPIPSLLKRRFLSTPETFMQDLDLLSLDGSWCTESSVSLVDGAGCVSMCKCVLERGDVYGCV